MYQQLSVLKNKYLVLKSQGNLKAAMRVKLEMLKLIRKQGVNT
jgi:hypothetical protein